MKLQLDSKIFEELINVFEISKGEKKSYIWESDDLSQYLKE